MGIVIHYRGQLKSVDLIDPLCDELIKIANLMKWEYTVLDADFGQPTHAHIEHTEKGAEIVGTLGIKGINLEVHEKCSSFSFYFDSQGILRDPVIMAGKMFDNSDELPYSFVKTQYAPPNVHMTIINLLRYLEGKYFHPLDVDDEGKYWETNDQELLKKNLNYLAAQIDLVDHTLENSDVKAEPNDSLPDICAKLDNILKDLGGSRMWIVSPED